jgi:hypothetical protein
MTSEARVQELERQVQQLVGNLREQHTDMTRLHQLMDAQAIQLQQQQAANNQVNVVRAKPAKPNTFHGEVRSNVYLWLAELQAYFLAIGLANNDRTVFSVAQLRDNALLWASSMPELSQPQNVGFDRFRELLLARFNPVTGATQARAELRVLQQTSSVSQYISDFQSIMQRITDMHDADRVDAFIQGLKPTLRYKCVEANTNNLNELMNLVQRLDTVYRMTHSQHFMHQHSFPSSSSSSSSSSSDHMQIDALNQLYDDYNENDKPHSNNIDDQSVNYMNRNTNRKWSAEKERLFRERKCFNCKQAGHTAANCDQRKYSDHRDRKRLNSKNVQGQRRN